MQAKTAIHVNLLPGDEYVSTKLAIYNETGNRIDVQTIEQLDGLVRLLLEEKERWVALAEKATGR